MKKFSDLKILYIKQNGKKSDIIDEFFSKNESLFYTSDKFNDVINNYKKNEIDIIILNFSNVTFNILSFLNKLKKQYKDQNVICIINNDEQNITEIINTGIYTYLSKPFKLESFINKLHKLLFTINLQKDITQQKSVLNNIAHKLRQPLSVISSSASSILLQKELNIYDENKLFNVLELIVKTARDMSKSIDTYTKVRI